MLTDYVNIGFHIEFISHLVAIVIGFFSLLFFLQIDKKKYGLLFILAALAGIIFCYIFVSFDFYSFPYLLFPKLQIMPFTAIALSFPIIVLFAVRYSPENWGWKIPFFWTIIHVGMLLETLASNYTDLITYNFEWDLWDSYTWWWIYFLVFEWIGGIIIPKELRKPLHISHLKFGKLGWAIIHFVLIVTIFLGGYYLGSLK
ncbi:CBO0543 family protein [Ornithinibacillus californiensis]|uniref:CBO0543 family protein n=1 Tax=Ornithinibacillus californiensis TaxID=161536 RepID=UPI00069D6462|nr:CBO0543 family protein [Ornithinibacillus californiensis]